MDNMKKNLDNSAPSLAVHLFGSIEILIHGVPLARLHSRKGVWLLALLTLRKGKPVERDWLVGTLWPNSSQSQALAYLRHCLTELRHALGTEAARLQSPTRQTLALDLAGAEVDALTFDADIQQGDPAALQRAVAIYRGPLLDDCTEEWALPERASREQSYLAALQCLADDALARDEVKTAIGYSRRIIGVDALQEGAQRTLIQAFAAAGDHAAAAQVYRDLRLHLHRELNAEPDPKTTALFNRLRAQTRQKATAAQEAASSLPAPSPPRRLPRPLTDLLGRDAEVLQVAARLRQRRLVTLTGTGGLGKTRLAIAVAETVVEEFADGAWFVELAGISDATLLVQSVATTLGVRDEPGRSLRNGLLSFLQPRLLLLVLDNCEHLLQACAQLAAELLDGCSSVRILATSRQALGITGEVNWPVPLLPVPDMAHLPSDAVALLANLSEVASVQLFVERAEAMQKDFGLTTRNAVSIARICERLDGIPLALELAAGNVKILPIEQIALRLDDVFRLLTRGSRTALPRQQTLQATLDWSYALLTEPERTLLQRLSVFAGGWTLETAEQVCSDEVLDLLTSLVDKSLVQVEERENGIRYRMLETVRQYARDRLVESGESDSARARHRDTFLGLAEETEPKLTGANQGEWLQRLEEEHENLRAALDWSLLETGMREGLRFCGALSRFWVTRGHLSEGREWCVRVMGKAEGQEHSQERAKALNGAGNLASAQGEFASSRAYFEESLALSQEIGDRKDIAESLKGMGEAACNQDDYAPARAYFEESLALYREIGDRGGIAHSLRGLGRVANFQSDYASSRTYSEESLALYREIRDRGGIAYSLNGLGIVAYFQGDYAPAQAYYDESLTLYREIGDRGGAAYSLNGLGNVALAQGDYASARAYYDESLTLYREIGDRRGIAWLLHDLGEPASAQGAFASARAYFEQSLAIQREIGDRQGVAWSLKDLGIVAFNQGDNASARAYFEQSLTIQREIRHRDGIASSLSNLGNVASAQGDNASARAYFEESLVIQREIGDRWGIADSLEAFAGIVANSGKSEQAAVLWGAAEALRGEIGAPLPPNKREAYDRTIAEVRMALGEAAFSAAWAYGCAMTPEAAAELALEISVS